MVGERRKNDLNGNPPLWYVSFRLNILCNKIHTLDLLQCIKTTFIEYAYRSRKQENEYCNEVYKQIPYFYIHLIKTSSAVIIVANA